MKILMLVNWKVKKCNDIPTEIQPPDYIIKGQDYWFYRYFIEKPEVDVIDISSLPFWEKVERNIFRFYIWQAIKAIIKMKKYDLIVSHGMQSGVVVSLWRRVFKTKAKHVVFDIGSFNSAAEEGFALKLMQFASRSINGIVYHTSSQINYYEVFFPWLVNKSKFIRFGTDLEYFDTSGLKESKDRDKYIICVGYSKRDWETVVQAYQSINTDIKLRMIGHVEEKFKITPGVEQIPFIPIQELKQQIYNALFCVLPLKSFNYSYGQMTLLQQMALGKCVVAADVPSLRDYIEDGKTAIMYEPQSVHELADKMKSVMRDETYRNKIGKNAVTWLRKACNEKIMAENIEQSFRKVAE